MTPAPQPQVHCDHEFVCIFFRQNSRVAWKDKTPCMSNHNGCKICNEDTRSRPAPTPDKGCHWYKENHCTREEWLHEWERRAGPTQITLTSELPAIIPPLPEGDTKDLKTWTEYWIKHDTAIRNTTIKEIIDYISPDLTTGNIVAYLQSLRTRPHQPKRSHDLTQLQAKSDLQEPVKVPQYERD